MSYVNEGKVERLNAFINNSATIKEYAGADIAAPAHLAVMYGADGNVIPATSGDKAIGLILSDTLDPVKKGGEVNILIKYIGLGVAGAAVNKGDLVSVDGAGKIMPAASGNFIFGRAFTAASEAGECVQVQINQMGVMA
jgi:hypothetical protein